MYSVPHGLERKHPGDALHKLLSRVELTTFEGSKPVHYARGGICELYSFLRRPRSPPTLPPYSPQFTWTVPACLTLRTLDNIHFGLCELQSVKPPWSLNNHRLWTVTTHSLYSYYMWQTGPKIFLAGPRRPRF